MSKIKEKYEDNQAINNRESWLKVILILLFSFIISWKIITTPLNIDLSDFNFSDFLALQLALFAIILSLVFYLKANETSNKFYDNTYKFTNDTSVLLGQIQAGFGERLRHLDEGYTGLADKIDNLTKVRAQVVKEEEEVKEIERERNQLLETLVERTNLQEDEKTELFNNLKKTENELNNAKDELYFLKRELSNAEEILIDRHDSGLSSLVKLIGEETIKYGNEDKIQERLNASELSRNFYTKLMITGLIDSNKNLTDKGFHALQYYSR